MSQNIESWYICSKCGDPGELSVCLQGGMPDSGDVNSRLSSTTCRCCVLGTGTESRRPIIKKEIILSLGKVIERIIRDKMVLTSLLHELM